MLGEIQPGSRNDPSSPAITNNASPDSSSAELELDASSDSTPTLVAANEQRSSSTDTHEVISIGSGECWSHC